MSTKNSIFCNKCNIKKIHPRSKGREVCNTCRSKSKIKETNSTLSEKGLNTNKKNGMERNYDCEKNAHSKVAKGSNNLARRNHR